MMMLKDCLPYFGRENKLKALIRLEHRLLAKHKTLSFVVNSYIYYKFHCDISAFAEIHESVHFPHPIGIVIGDGVSIGPGCSIVLIYPNSVVIGNVHVRKGSIIGAGSVITKDTEANSVNYGVAASCHRIHDEF